MQVIITTYTQDAAQRPVIDAVWAGKRVSWPYDRTQGLDDNHVAAALKLAHALGWAFDFVCGRLESGDYCHVPMDERRRFTSHTADSVKSPGEFFRGRPTPYGRHQA